MAFSRFSITTHDTLHFSALLHLHHCFCRPVLLVVGLKSIYGCCGGEFDAVMI